MQPLPVVQSLGARRSRTHANPFTPHVQRDGAHVKGPGSKRHRDPNPLNSHAAGQSGPMVFTPDYKPQPVELLPKLWAHDRVSRGPLKVMAAEVAGPVSVAIATHEAIAFGDLPIPPTL